MLLPAQRQRAINLAQELVVVPLPLRRRSRESDGAYHERVVLRTLLQVRSKTQRVLELNGERPVDEAYNTLREALIDVDCELKYVYNILRFYEPYYDLEEDETFQNPYQTSPISPSSFEYDDTSSVEEKS